MVWEESKKKVRSFITGKGQKGFSSWDCHLGLKCLKVAGRAFRERRKGEGVGVCRDREV